MLKRFLVILLSIFFLVACGQKEENMKVDFKGPTYPPDPAKMMPTYGPNDPVPTDTNSKSN